LSDLHLDSPLETSGVFRCSTKQDYVRSKDFSAMLTTAQKRETIWMRSLNMGSHQRSLSPADPLAENTRTAGPLLVYRRSKRILTFSMIGMIFFLSVCPSTAERAEAQTVSNFNNSRDFLWNNDVEPCLPGGMGCKAVQKKPGYFLFQDSSTGQFLLIPDILVSGIEANIQQLPVPAPPAVPSMTLPNYWSEAFDWAKHYHPTVPPTSLGVAINSANARTQDQLHIHICTLLPEVIATLKNPPKAIGDKWNGTPFLSLGEGNHMYDAIHIANLASENPFVVLFQDPGASGTDGRSRRMADQNIVVTAAPGGGYYILNNGDGGAVEELLNLSGKCM
jgi:CDP-diacylglycerol pyrophosphatase